MKIATFKALLRDDTEMVAGIAALEGGIARFFVRQDDESADEFVGRISTWVKSQDGERIQMAPPDLLPAGIEVPAVILEIRKSLGVDDSAPADAFDIGNADLVLDITAIAEKSGTRQDN